MTVGRGIWLNPAYKKIRNQAGQLPAYALVAAAGSGSRMGQNKQLIELDGIPVIIRTLRALHECTAINSIILLVAAAEMHRMEELLLAFTFPRLLAVTPGGASRQATVTHGLACLAQLLPFQPDSPVLVHDGARCLVKPELIRRVIRGINQHQACGAAVPVKDTIKIADPSGRVLATPERSGLWAMQTPQGARWQLLDLAYKKAAVSGLQATDDLAVLEAAGQPVFLVRGDYSNIKLTTPEDIKIARSLL